MNSVDIAGFWSYTHSDDERDGGRVLRLAALLQDEFALLTGSQLEVFVDRNDLKWGDEWRLRIENALATTTFFIPVITPLFFKSEECRKELLRFVGHARSVGAEELVLPLLYLDVPELHVDAPGDEAIAVVKARQWQDCRALRLLAEDDPEFRLKVNELARRLIEINDSLPVRSGPVGVELATGEGTREAAEEDAPGYMELFVAAEEAMPRWLQTMEALPQVMERLSAIAEDFGQRMEVSDAQGGNFAAKLRITRQFADAIGEPADEVLGLGQEYSASLVALDPAIISLTRLIEEDSEQATPEEIHDFFVQVRELAEIARETTQRLRELVAILDQTRRMSRDLGPPIDRIKQGLRQISDGQSVFDEWELRFAELDARQGTSGREDKDSPPQPEAPTS
jgi:hypothetical protein